MADTSFTLLGAHELRAVVGDLVDPTDDSSNGLAIQLDDHYAFAFEDPDDGYRSYMSDVEILTTDEFHARFPGAHKPLPFPIPVVVSEPLDSNFVGIEVFDARNQKCILALGTDESCNYYPNAVAWWQPENIQENNP